MITLITLLFIMTKMMSRIIMMDPTEHMDLIRDSVCISCKGTSCTVPSQHSSPE